MMFMCLIYIFIYIYIRNYIGVLYILIEMQRYGMNDIDES